MRQDLLGEQDVEFNNQFSALLLTFMFQVSLGVDHDVAAFSARHSFSSDSDCRLRINDLGGRD